MTSEKIIKLLCVRCRVIVQVNVQVAGDDKRWSSVHSTIKKVREFFQKLQFYSIVIELLKCVCFKFLKWDNFLFSSQEQNPNLSTFSYGSLEAYGGDEM